MIRRLTSAVLLLAAVGLMVGMWMQPARAQFPAPVVPAFRIMGQHNQIANVTHLGELVVNAQVNATVDNIRHISSVTHVAIVGGLSVSTSVDNISHITSATHVVAHVVRSFGKHAIDVVDRPTESFRVNIVGGGLSSGGSVSQSGAWVVTAAHQGNTPWTIAHISSVTHVAVASGSITVTGGPVAVTQSGAWTNLNINHIASVVHVAIAGASGGSLPVNQSGSWTIQAAHQGGEWNIRHIGSDTHVAVVRGTINRLDHVTSTVHVAGIIRGFGTAGTNVVDTSNASLQVSCVSGCSQNSSINHITSVVHVQGAGGGLRVQQSSQNGGNRWVVDHIASVVHVALVGDQSLTSVSQSGTWNINHISSVVHVAGQLEAVGQWNTAHITSITHVAGLVRGFGARGIDVVDLVNNSLSVSCVSGCTSNTSIAHITSVTHIGGSVGATPVTIWIRDGATTRLAHVDSSGNLQVALAVANISHLTSVTHIAGNVEVNNVRHVTSVVHVAGIIRGFGTQGISVVDATNQSLQVTQVAGGGSAAQSGSWTIQAAHLGPISNIQHIGGALHLAGTINGARIHIQGVGQPGAAHGGVMSIQGVTGMVPLEVNCTGCSAAASVNVAHISSVTHISGSVGGIPVTTWIRDGATTRLAHVDSSGALLTSTTVGSISHITSVMHVTLIPSTNATSLIGVAVPHVNSVTHVAGIIRGFGKQGTDVVDPANAALQVNCVVGCSSGGTVSHVTSLTHVVIVDWQRWAHVASAQSGTWNINAHQAGTWSINAFQGAGWVVTGAHQAGEWNTRHITSVTHIQGSVFIASKQDPTRTVAVTHGNALLVHVTGFGPNNGEPTFCHSTAAFVVHAGTNVAPVIHTGGGERIAICSIVIVSSVAGDVSLVEGNTANGDQNNQGVWSGGCGARVGGSINVWTPLLGGASTGIANAANGGISSISGIPWLKTATRGNSVCLVKQNGGGHVTGTITYAGYR